MTSYALITGGLGLIGSFISRELIASKIVDKVVCLDHFGRYIDTVRPEFLDYRRLRIQGIEDKIVIERGEAKHFTVLNKIINQYKPEFIFHLAALPLAKLDNLNTEEARSGSVDSTTNLLEIIGQMKSQNGYCPKRFVYASSSMVYGDFMGDSANEGHPLNPKEIYGTMKLAGENITRGLGNFFDVPYSIVRPSAVYGPTDMNRRVSQIFIEKAISKQKLKVNGEGEKLDFTYVKDIAKGFVLAATRPGGAGETFNITYGQASTLLDFVKALEVHFPDLKYEITARDDFRPQRGTLQIDKARELLGYKPEYDIEKGVGEYVDFLKKHHPAFQD